MSDKARQDIDLDDPDFWKKWAKKASVDLDQLDQVSRIYCMLLSCHVCVFE